MPVFVKFCRCIRVVDGCQLYMCRFLQTGDVFLIEVNGK